MRLKHALFDDKMALSSKNNQQWVMKDTPIEPVTHASRIDAFKRTFRKTLAIAEVTFVALGAPAAAAQAANYHTDKTNSHKTTEKKVASSSQSDEILGAGLLVFLIGSTQFVLIKSKEHRNTRIPAKRQGVLTPSPKNELPARFDIMDGCPSALPGQSASEYPLGVMRNVMRNQALVDTIYRNDLKKMHRILNGKKSININAMSGVDGRSPAFVAVSQGNVEAMQLLHMHGADFELVNEHGVTPLTHIAKIPPEGDFRATMSFLREIGVNPLLLDNDGKTARYHMSLEVEQRQKTEGIYTKEEMKLYREMLRFLEYWESEFQLRN